MPGQAGKVLAVFPESAQCLLLGTDPAQAGLRAQVMLGSSSWWPRALAELEAQRE